MPASTEGERPRKVIGRASPEKPSAPEDAQNELVEGRVHVRREVRDLVSDAEALDLAEVVAVRGLHLGEQGVRHCDLALVTGLAVVEVHVAAEGWTRVGAIRH